MAAMEPPPPRYRIVERKGRLIATDTWAENRPGRADAPMLQAGAPRPTVPTRPGGMPGMRDAGLIDRLGTVLLLGLCTGSIDGTGNPILTTANFYDVEGPRQIVLGPAGAKRLGRWLVAIAAVMAVLALLIFSTPWGFIIAFVVVGLVASNANTAARPAITRWLDRLERAA
jgi:hypothetical protein